MAKANAQRINLTEAIPLCSNTFV